MTNIGKLLVAKAHKFRKPVWKQPITFGIWLNEDSEIFEYNKLQTKIQPTESNLLS